ncbi:hypothetical protein K457DRAFT_142375 [Linnemannia elongata AG-77]|uniref:Uncharacterized protein n=1 Tax=Linnemannia elongata AG-77 TaxID=1314771 RepID=A0A197JF95_9FUNG|nr:hypothetical protein K457DRAFT_142375 [Linnemannia elongata AG-77]
MPFPIHLLSYRPLKDISHVLIDRSPESQVLLLSVSLLLMYPHCSLLSPFRFKHYTFPSSLGQTHCPVLLPTQCAHSSQIQQLGVGFRLHVLSFSWFHCPRLVHSIHTPEFVRVISEPETNSGA